MVRGGMLVGSLDMSIATGRRQFYDSEIVLLLGVVTLIWSVATGLLSAGSMTKRFLSFARKRIVRQGGRRLRHNAKAQNVA